MTWRAALLTVALAGPVWGQTDPTLLAMRAQGQLDAAALALTAAEGAQDRVAALTQTVRAYESGLEAMRAGLRAAAAQERALAGAFEAKRDEVARLLGVLAAIGQAPAPLTLLHPSGPLGTVRSGLVLGDVTPALQAEADVVRRDLQALLHLRAILDDATAGLTRSLMQVEDARVALATAVSERTDLPQAFAADPERMADLARSTASLDTFTKSLGALAADTPAPMSLETRKGGLVLPVDGRVVRYPGETDANGSSRPGLTLATYPAALVTSPLAGSVLYAGPLLDYGNVILLEPVDRIMMVFAGLGPLYAQQGSIVGEGDPLGLMGGQAPGGGEFVVSASEGAGSLRSETLYIEVRRDEVPEDPTGWFAVTQN